MCPIPGSIGARNTSVACTVVRQERQHANMATDPTGVRQQSSLTLTFSIQSVLSSHRASGVGPDASTHLRRYFLPSLHGFSAVVALSWSLKVKGCGQRRHTSRQARKREGKALEIPSKPLTRLSKHSSARTSRDRFQCSFSEHLGIMAA